MDDILPPARHGCGEAVAFPNHAARLATFTHVTSLLFFPLEFSTTFFELLFICFRASHGHTTMTYTRKQVVTALSVVVSRELCRLIS